MTSKLKTKKKIAYLDKPWLKQYPPGFPREVDIPEITVTQLMDDAVKRYSEDTALMFYGTEISYEKLGDYIEKMASALHDLGVKRNSVVALYLPNCPQFIISYYAVQKLGAIPTAVSFLFSPREIELQLKDSGAECVVMIDLLYNKLKPVINKLGIDKVVLTDMMYFMPSLKKNLARLLRRVPKANIPKSEPVHFLEHLIKRDDVKYPVVNVDPKKDLASIIYTSGTTGDPKGVELTHYNVLALIEQVKAHAGDIFQHSKYVLAYLPLFHVYGQMFIMVGCLSWGQNLILILRPQIKEMLKFIEKYKITLLFGVPAFYRMMIKEIKRGSYDLSSLTLCACGSDYTSQALVDEWEELTGAYITEGYGLTEACPTTGIPIGGAGKRGSIGIPLASIFAAIADPKKDKFVKVGEIGEIIINGPQVTRGYWKKGKKNAKYFSKIAGKKWLRSGDLGYMDNEGYFYMVERIKDLIKYKAYSIYPGEVEDIISKYEPVEEVAVIGKTADVAEYGQIIKAFVVLKGEHKGTVSKEDIITFCKDNLAVYKLPKEIEFIDELPKNAMGKVIRKELREKA